MTTFIAGILALSVATLLVLFGSKIRIPPFQRRDGDGIPIRDSITSLIHAALPSILGRTAPIAVAAIGIVLLANSFFVEVPAGNQGIVLTFKAASDETLAPGLGFKAPWQDVQPVSTRAVAWTQKFECQSKDLQKMWVTMTLVYRRSTDAVASVYKRVREDSEEIDVKPGGRETLKASVAEFDAENLIRNRPDLALSVTEGMKDWIDPKGLEMMRCSIADVDFEDSYDERVESKVIALEKAREAQNELIMQQTIAEITKMAASGRKEGAKENARGDSESRQIVAEAEAYSTEVVAAAEAYSRAIVGAAEAERIVWQAKALGNSRAALTMEAITKWNGEVPDFTMEGGKPALPFEFLKTDETLTDFDAPIEELETALNAHQEKMVEEAKTRLKEEQRLEALQLKRELEEAELLKQD